VTIKRASIADIEAGKVSRLSSRAAAETAGKLSAAQIEAAGAEDAMYDFDIAEAEWVADGPALGRPKKAVTKEVINIAFEPDTLRHLRATGRGWQTRVREYVEQGILAGAL
jgi:uncharacterized protein (DUF4415 family)